MGKTAFLFPGQGSQSVGMMGPLAAACPQVEETFAAASEVLGHDLWAVCQEGPAERLNQTMVTQPAMLAADVATWRVWRDRGGGTPQGMAGHSLGEYAALVAAGAVAFADAVGLVAERARLMQEATPEGVGAMAAILGLDEAVLQEVCLAQARDEVVQCANFNAPGQVVIAGHRDAVGRVCEAATRAGARRAVPLPVSVPSHCLLMKEAAVALAERLDGTDFSTPEVPVLQNADVAAFSEPAEIRAALTRQLWCPVQWTRTIEHFAATGVRRFVECGPGKVLTGLNRRIVRDAEAVALTDLETLTATIEGIDP